MRLAIFTSKYPARVATFFERDVRALIESGVDVEIFPIYPLDPSLWRYRLDILDERVLPASRVHHVPIGRALASLRPWPARQAGTFARDAYALARGAAPYGIEPLAKSLYVLPKAWAWAREHAGRFDHVLGYWGNYAATAAYVFHRLTNPDVPFTIWVHAGTDLYRTPVFLREKLLHADGIVTCCEFNRGFIAEQFPDIAPQIAHRIHVCYHGLDLADFAFEPDGRPSRRVVAVGRFMANKGFDYLLRAAGQLAARGAPIDVDLVGDGDERASLEALARQLGIAERVRFRGWLPFTEARRAMREATLLVHPSGGLGDGLPNVLREAMAIGTPVIASRVAGIPEALDDGRCGILVEPRDVDALADAIDGLLADPEARRRYAERGRRRTEEKFDLWRNGRALADRLRATVPRSGASRWTAPLPGPASSPRDYATAAVD